MTFGFRYMTVVFAGVMVCTEVLASPDDDDDDGFVSGQAIVELAPGATIDQFNTAFGTTTIEVMLERPIFLVAVPPGQDEEAFELATDLSPLVEEVHLDYLGAPSDPGSDTRSIYTGATAPLFENTTAFNLIGVDQPYAQWRTVVVGLIDGGVDNSHPELSGRMVPGFNFINNSPATPDIALGTDSNTNGVPDEAFGHGTFVAGLIAATAPEAKIMPLQVMDTDGQVTAFRLARAIFAATDAGVDILNISMSSNRLSELVEDALDEAENADIIIVASAGNSGLLETRYPAGSDSGLLVGVAATDNADVMAPFSTYGEGVSMTAPGVDVVSLLPDGWPADAPVTGHGYAAGSGTSFSAPLVTGALATAMGRCTTTKPEDLLDAASLTAADLSAANPGQSVHLGAGRIDLHAMLGVLNSCPADQNDDGVLNLDDVGQFVTGFLAGEDSSDLDASGALNFDDLDLFVTMFIGACI